MKLCTSATDVPFKINTRSGGASNVNSTPQLSIVNGYTVAADPAGELVDEPAPSVDGGTDDSTELGVEVTVAPEPSSVESESEPHAARATADRANRDNT
jgi:hypothetical protein